MKKEPSPDTSLIVKHGRPVIQGTFQRVKLITTILSILLLLDTFLSLKLLISSIKIRSHIGYYINMISSGGDTLPSLQAVPVFFFLVLNVAMCYLLYKAFDETENPGINRLMFLVVLIGFAFLIIIFIIIITVIAHAYSAHSGLHDGITLAMNNYSTNIKFKTQMDKLQIEFQCCGSKAYDEWYTIKWYDSSLERKSTESADGNTPFSCCSMNSPYPCVHHRIEVTGQVYMYTPEFNLSISTRGCYEILRERNQSVGWTIVLNLLFYLFLQGCTVAAFRFIQTGHFEQSKFMGRDYTYTMWLFGCSTGKTSENTKKESDDNVKHQKHKGEKKPPPVPPLPPELMDEEKA